MSFVIAASEMMTSAAADLAAIGSNVAAAHMAAAARTVAVLPAAADAVSASIAHLFSQHAANYQAMAAQAAAFSDPFVQHLKTDGGPYAGAAAASLQPLTAPAAAFPIPNVLNLLPQLAANPLLIPAVLLVLGVLAYLVIAVLALNFLIELGGLVPPQLLMLPLPWLGDLFLAT
jgi:PE family